MQFEINHLNKEYLVSVEGYFNDSKSEVIQGLQFKTNFKTSDLIGYDDGKKFRLAANGMKIIGFYGYAEKNLNSLGAYFTTTPITKLEYIGDTINGELWDDGAFEGVRKVYIYYHYPGVKCVRFNYDNGGKVKRLQHGVKHGQEEEVIFLTTTNIYSSTCISVHYTKPFLLQFVVDYPNEFITYVEGTLLTSGPSSCVSSLTFKTSKGRTSPTFGSVTDNKFVIESKGCSLVGFHGESDGFIRALGAYFRPLPPLPDAEKIEAQGGDGGASWDDGGFDGIRNIYIGHNGKGIVFVKFLYDKDNQVTVGDDHGNKTFLEVDEVIFLCFLINLCS